MKFDVEVEFTFDVFVDYNAEVSVTPEEDLLEVELTDSEDTDYAYGFLNMIFSGTKHFEVEAEDEEEAEFRAKKLIKKYVEEVEKRPDFYFSLDGNIDNACLDFSVEVRWEIVNVEELS